MNFGQSSAINRGVVRAHCAGIVTSASLMVRWAAAPEAVCYARSMTSLSLGLHVDFGEWAYDADTFTWQPLHHVLPTDDVEFVTDEVDRQLAQFRSLVGRDPTHLDSHQHAHREDPLRSCLAAVASRLGIPLRDVDTGVTYNGGFYGQSNRGYPHHVAISAQALLSLLRALPPGVTELGCHPGEVDELSGMYRAERAMELRTLCDPLVRAALGDLAIDLRSFGDLQRA
jgi:chitin disaccharide deacetylase